MSFDTFKTLRRTLAFRLTFWHAAIFVVSSSLAFFVFFSVLKSSIEQRTDSSLADQMKECAKLLSTRGVDAVKAELVNTAEATGTHDIYLRLLSSDGRELGASDATAWKNFEIDPDAMTRIPKDKPLIETIKVRGRGKVRVAYASIGHDKVLQIGLSLKDDEQLLGYSRWVFVSALAVLAALAILVTWLTATRTLSKVDRVTQTALNISRGSISERVPVSPQGDEIDRLSATFNRMLDQIQILVSGMKEITDNLAHELRSPITRMRGTAETTLCGDGELDEYQNLAAGTVEDCDRLLGLINTMLDISEAEAGMTKINKSPVDLPAIVQDVCELFATVAEDKGVVLQVEKCPPCTVAGDKEKLQRIIANLIDNAIKYTPTGGRVTVALRTETGEAHVVVVDSGIGISAEEMPRIFDRFYRSDKSRAERGHGLGLSLARALARMHGGDIVVKSSPNSGSEFTVSLPCLRN